MRATLTIRTRNPTRASANLRKLSARIEARSMVRELISGLEVARAGFHFRASRRRCHLSTCAILVDAELRTAEVSIKDIGCGACIALPAAVFNLRHWRPGLPFQHFSAAGVRGSWRAHVLRQKDCRSMAQSRRLCRSSSQWREESAGRAGGQV